MWQANNIVNDLCEWYFCLVFFFPQSDAFLPLIPHIICYSETLSLCEWLFFVLEQFPKELLAGAKGIFVG